MKNILICFTILVITYSCKKRSTGNNNSNQNGSDIFPNKVGDTWIYLVNDTSYAFSNSATISQYNMTISIIDSVQLPGAIKANRWVYTYPGGTDTNYVYQHGDTISFAANTLPSLYILRQYVIPLRLHNSWQYVESYFIGSLHNVTVDSVSAIIVGENHFENAYALRGIPGMPDNFFYIEEWIADHVGVVKKYFNNRGYTIGPDQHKTSWSLVSYHLQ
jgi:hypothetical protein